MLGRLKISLKACKERDEIVFKTAQNLNIPTVAVMGGGYSKDIKQIIEAHANTYRIAKEIFF
jgi:acetoin utilization deacetylase AcuC-like enzyme